VCAQTRAHGTCQGDLAGSCFFFWAANQLLPNYRQATLFNDIAIDFLFSMCFWS